MVRRACKQSNIEILSQTMIRTKCLVGLYLGSTLTLSKLSKPNSTLHDRGCQHASSSATIDTPCISLERSETILDEQISSNTPRSSQAHWCTGRCMNDDTRSVNLYSTIPAGNTPPPPLPPAIATAIATAMFCHCGDSVPPKQQQSTNIQTIFF